MKKQEQFETLDPQDWQGMRDLGYRMIDDVLAYFQDTGDRKSVV